MITNKVNTSDENRITADAFLNKLWEEYRSYKSDVIKETDLDKHEILRIEDYQDFINSGISKGWLPADFLSLSFPNRKTIALLVHEFILKECFEADEEDISPASKLKDLYDCHVCVNHIAQVYSKGIMESDTQETLVFGTAKCLQKTEADLIVKRIFYRNLRKLPMREASVKNANKITYKEALNLLQDRKVKLIDVRSKKEYDENHIKGAYHILLSEILNNPYQVAEKMDTQLLFYCEQAYQSQIAANCVTDSGYSKVSYFGMKES